MGWDVFKLQQQGMWASNLLFLVHLKKVASFISSTQEVVLNRRKKVTENMLVTRQVRTVINYQNDWKWHCQVSSQKIWRIGQLINREHDLIYIMVFYAHWDKINWPSLLKVPCYHGLWLWRCLCAIAPIKIVLFFFNFLKRCTVQCVCIWAGLSR